MSETLFIVQNILNKSCIKKSNAIAQRFSIQVRPHKVVLFSSNLFARKGPPTICHYYFYFIQDVQKNVKPISVPSNPRFSCKLCVKKSFLTWWTCATQLKPTPCFAITQALFSEAGSRIPWNNGMQCFGTTETWTHSFGFFAHW